MYKGTCSGGEKGRSWGGKYREGFSIYILLLPSLPGSVWFRFAALFVSFVPTVILLSPLLNLKTF